MDKVRTSRRIGIKVENGLFTSLTVKFTFINHWRDAVVINIRKPAARSPRMGIDCDSSQCHSVLILQYQKLLKHLVQAPQHAEMSPAIYNRVHGLTLERCNVQQPKYTELLRSEVSATHKQNPSTEICPMPVIPKLYHHRLRCFTDIHVSVTLQLLLLTYSRVHPASSSMGTSAFFLALNRWERKAEH